MAVKLTVKRNRGVLRRLKMMDAEVRRIVGEEIESTTLDIQDLAIADVPVDHGILKATIYAVSNRETLQGETGATARYAPYVEFGTGGMVNIPAGLEDYAIQFKGKGVRQISMMPRPFLFNNARQQSKVFVDRVRRRTRKLLK